MDGVTTQIKLDQRTIDSANLADLFTKDDLVHIGEHVHSNYVRDFESRADWFRRNAAAMDLAMQVQKSKSFPWQGCSNVAFPLITIAAMQFHSRAYPALINGREIVKCETIGEDKDGVQAARAKRIAQHMSWQLLQQNQDWEADMDRALLVLPILGCLFKKTYYSPDKGRNESSVVLPQNLIFNYWAKSVETCPVKTEVLQLHRNTIYERVRRGIYEDVLDETWFLADAQPSATPYSTAADNREGKQVSESSEDTPFTVLEQHCCLDLDGDGYAEPYVVTIEESSQTVLRIVTRFDRIEDIEYNNRKQIIAIHGWECYTKIPFIPSPDGGVLDVGFGTLLGPLNESVNSAINQLFDAGTMANTAGGFLGRGAKIKGGVYEFSPFGWNRVDSTGDDLRKNIFPLPVREPSPVIFNLLSLLIDYTNRISGSVDMMTGVTPGQNTPAETTRSAMEQGEKIYSAIFKRVWRSLKWEFNKLYTLNGRHTPTRLTYGSAGTFVLQEDYTQSGGSVIPVADPTISSGAAKLAKATMLKAAAQAGGGYDQDAVEREWLGALGYSDVDRIYPGLANMPPPPPDVKIQLQTLKNQAQAMALQHDQMKFILTLRETVRLNDAKIAEFNASAFKLQQEGAGLATQQNINAFNAATNALKEHNRALEMQINRMMQDMEKENATAGNIAGIGAQGAIPQLESPPSDQTTV